MLKRINNLCDYVCEKKNYRSYDLKEYVSNELKAMIKSKYISELYRQMFSEDSRPETFIWEDGCAMALLKILLKGPPEITGDKGILLILDQHHHAVAQCCHGCARSEQGQGAQQPQQIDLRQLHQPGAEDHEFGIRGKFHNSSPFV